MSVHRFEGITFDGYFIPFLKLRCVNCGMRVGVAAARQLEGLPCR